MLDKEQWRQLPTPVGQGTLREAFTSEGPAAGGSPSQSPRPGPGEGRTRTFEQWLAAGNPWRSGALHPMC